LAQHGTAEHSGGDDELSLDSAADFEDPDETTLR